MQSLVELIKGVSKAALLGALGAAFLWKHRDDFLALTRMDIGAALGDGVSLTLSLLAWMVGGLIVIAAIDAPYQWFSHANKLKMSRQEVRDEYKQDRKSTRLNSSP